MKKSKDEEIDEIIDLTPEVLQGLIEESVNIGVTPMTLFLKDIGKIDALEATGTINRVTGETRLLVLDDAGGMWQIKEEFVIARRTNIMEPEDYEYFNRIKRESEENTKKWEENEEKLGLNCDIM